MAKLKETLKLFTWESELLRGYLTGTIIVLAKDAGEARQKAEAYFDDWHKKRYDYLYESTDEWDRKVIAQDREALNNDLAKEPATQTVLFIRGGD